MRFADQPRPPHDERSVRRPARLRLWSVCACALAATAASLASDPVAAQIQFEEVSAAAGLTYAGPSYGASWGDFDDDGHPDLYLSHHARASQLLRNNGDGTFSDASSVFDALEGDTHGAAWGDFDNDGYPDLLQVVGADAGTGVGANQFLVNTAGQLLEEASARGLAYPASRARTPTWFDWNADGDLDVFVASQRRQDGAAPSALFTQIGGVFVEENLLVGLQTTGDNSFAQIAGLTDDAYPALLVHGSWPYPEGFYRYDVVPFQDVTTSLAVPSFANTRDVAVADFDGDLRNDLYLVRGRDDSMVLRTAENAISASLLVKTAGQHGFQFTGSDVLDFRGLSSSKIAPTSIFIGAAGWHPAGNDFSLSASDAAVLGLPSYAPGVDKGLYIGFDQATSRWSVYFSSPSFASLGLIVEGGPGATLSEPEPVGFVSSNGELADKLLLQRDGKFVDFSATSGIGPSSACESVVAADFDNDMDVDLYLVCRGAVRNSPNVLLENLGAGVFVRVPLAGGAEGDVAGRGDSAAAADFDGDGFIDLVVTNGQGASPFNEGPDLLFRNLGNENHWLQIDLEGVSSNRDGVGARVFVTAGGITQLREQNGGIHQYSQNHQRLHVGLGAHEEVDELIVQWPDGTVQLVNAVPADSVIRVIQGGVQSILGKPSYQPGAEAGLYLWKETFDGPYQLRVSGDGVRSNYVVRVMADRPIDEVIEVGLSQNDSLTWQENSITMTGWVKTWQDGVDFTVAPDARVIVSYERVGTPPHARQLHVGQSASPIAPSGWILDVNSLPTPPPFEGGVDLGLFVGWDPVTSQVAARWNGDRLAGGQRHRGAVHMLFSDSFFQALPVGLEANDSLTTSTYGVDAAGLVGSWWDGVDVAVDSGAVMALSYEQDGLFQPHRVNGAQPPFRRPNAYTLPPVSGAGAPTYDPQTEGGLFLWRDDASGTWRLRATAGGTFASYRGAIVGSAPAISVTAVGLEGNDTLDKSNLSRIVFDLKVGGPWQDGIDFEFPESAEVRLESDGAAPIDANRVRIGAARWPVAALPVVLSAP